ncbi:MAG: hypothetical protein WCJ51_01000 [Candidatus Moraniibacteriota bacterium]
MDILANSLAETVSSFKMAGQAFGHFWFIALPPLLYWFFEVLWMYHIKEAFWASNNWVLLEVIPPKNIERSPKPMESFFNGIGGLEKSFTNYEIYARGEVVDYMSIEMTSEEGVVHFYMRTMKRNRHLVEANLYAQYPDVEINEVPDYINNVPKFVPNSQWDVWGADVATTQKHHAYPIRTYPSFEESVTGKMIDPLGGLIEIFGKAGPGEFIWLQWVIKPTKPDWSEKTGKELADKLKGREKKKEKILERLVRDITDVITNVPKFLTSPVEFEAEKKKDEQPLDMRLSPVERDVLKAVETNLGKVQFYTKGRCLYIGKREVFDKALGVAGIWGAMKQFGDNNMNGFKPDGDSKTSAYYRFTKTRLNYKKHKLFRRYKNRNRDGFSTVLSSEELATIYHFPDMNVLSPALTRVEAKRSGAPANLPIE